MKTNGKNLDSYEKAYKAICKRIGARSIEVGRNLHSVYVLLEDEHYESIQAPKSFSSFSLFAPCRFQSRKEIVNFLLKTAVHGQLKCQGIVAVYENESLENLAVEFDLES